MNGKRKKSRLSVGGYLAFFALVAAIITCALLIYGAVEKSVSSVGEVAGIMFAVVIVLAAVCTAVDLFRRRIMVDKPVEKILVATEKIAGGDFSVRLQGAHPSGKYDEYDSIMYNVSRMAEELSHNEVLKTDFISNLSHEIKTPVSLIYNLAVILKDGSVPPEKREECADSLVGAARRLTDLVNNILKLNKLENQGVMQKPEHLRAGDVLSEAALGFEEIIDKKRLNLQCDIDDASCYADRTLLEIICNNLISNAVKFTSENGSIFLSLKDMGGVIELNVRDTGCGMDSETGARIFEKFYQGDVSRSGEGNGLGLALVKKAVTVMGGEIKVESKKGKGSQFTVRLKKNDE